MQVDGIIARPPVTTLGPVAGNTGIVPPYILDKLPVAPLTPTNGGFVPPYILERLAQNAHHVAPNGNTGIVPPHIPGA